MEQRQFIGGHVEENENLLDALSREIMEESGIDIHFDNLIPFLKIKYYSRNYPQEGLNTLTINNYYIVRTDLKPNFNNTHLTDYEKKWEYTIKYVSVDKAIKVLEDSLAAASKKNPVLDTIEALKEFVKINEDDTRRSEWR